MAVRVEVALRRVSSAHVRDDGHVAALECARDQRLVAIALLTIGRADKQHGRPRVTGSVEVRAEREPVAQRDPQFGPGHVKPQPSIRNPQFRNAGLKPCPTLATRNP